MFSKRRYSRKGNLKKCTSFEEQNGTRTRYVQGNVCFGIIVFSCLSSKKICLRFLFSFLFFFFAQEIKRFFQGSLGKSVDFTNILSVSPNALVKNQNFKKLRHIFVDERAMITITLISYWHLKILVPFCLRKKKPENAFLTLAVNYWKVLQENTVKTTVNWLFNDI